MKWFYYKTAILLCAGVSWMVWPSYFVGAEPSLAHPFLLGSTPTPVVAPVSSAPPSDAFLGLIGNIVVALATLVAALIAGIFGWRYLRYQTHKTQELARKNQELQQRLESASRGQQFADELEKSRYDDWLVERREAQDRERQRRKHAHAEARATMLQAQTLVEREAAYRNAIREIGRAHV